jgi:hypothetical protein
MAGRENINRFGDKTMGERSKRDERTKEAEAEAEAEEEEKLIINLGYSLIVSFHITALIYRPVHSRTTL